MSIYKGMRGIIRHVNARGGYLMNIDFKTIIEFVMVFIGGLGGFSVIVLALSKWLSDIIAKKYIEKVKYEYQLEINKVKQKYDIELTEIKSKFESLTYVSNIQYEKEFSIYLEIWESMINCVALTNALYPSGMNYAPTKGNTEEYLGFCKNKYKEYVHAYNLYLANVEKYEPFYDESVYSNFKEILNICSKVGNIFNDEEIQKYISSTFTLVQNDRMDIEDTKYVYIESKKEIKEIKEKLRIDIKSYLDKLKVK